MDSEEHRLLPSNVQLQLLHWAGIQILHFLSAHLFWHTTLLPLPAAWLCDHHDHKRASHLDSQICKELHFLLQQEVRPYPHVAGWFSHWDDCHTGLQQRQYPPFSLFPIPNPVNIFLQLLLYEIPDHRFQDADENLVSVQSTHHSNTILLLIFSLISLQNYLIIH